MPISVLVTQCLQNDFVGLIPANAPLPNQLHIGPTEALRLLGESPEHGALAAMLALARATPDLHIFHVRDEHRADDPAQAGHLAQFGAHCLAGSEGAGLVFSGEPSLNECSVSASGLSDFEEGDLGTSLAALKASAPDGELKVGVIGVWTDAKVSFLLYDLATRLKVKALATCSALTASASRSQHFNALSQLSRLLGVSVFDSVGDFAHWLCPGTAYQAPETKVPGFIPPVEGAALPEGDDQLLASLYRDSAKLTLKALSGGYSGASVMAVQSQDAYGQQQAPSVLKLGPRGLIAKERAAFERVEAVLGNDAPGLKGAAELGERGGLKYAYAGMGRGGVRTFQRLYQGGMPQDEVQRTLDVVFQEILGRFYRAAQGERLPLLAHYGFSPTQAVGLAARVAALLPGQDPDGATLTFPGGLTLPNVVRFYKALDLAAEPLHHWPVSYVHGDLNGANILVDERGNPWIIDFFHTERRYVLQDLAKFENDLYFLFTDTPDEAAFRGAWPALSALNAQRSLAEPWSGPAGLAPPWLKAVALSEQLRGMASEWVKDWPSALALQVARLRYAAHTLSFDEASPWAKRLALATACELSAQVGAALQR